jgi:hypothetical protein
MSRLALHAEVIREALRSTRAARTKAMELPPGPHRIATLEALRVAVDSLQESLALVHGALRAEVRQ